MLAVLSWVGSLTLTSMKGPSSRTSTLAFLLEVMPPMVWEVSVQKFAAVMPRVDSVTACTLVLLAKTVTCGRGGVVAGARRVATGEQDVLIGGVRGIAAVLEGHAQVVAGDGRGGAVTIDVAPGAGAGLAQGFDRGRAGEVVTDVGAGDMTGEMRPGHAGHRFGPAERGGFGGAVDGEGIVCRCC